ncbi:GGDEF domain-containing protein [Fundidesulfovibrio terrae]|uniref:GGDEF domain-containing protein n=1 Tax=Fundidesulfovibrio terrae TaxID=2922866 RepID=UPI001FB01F8B|nr:GGDEF domain-containing protein [Fundidesulfovibrio terrae]
MPSLDLLSVAIVGLMLHSALALVMIQTYLTRKTYPGFSSWTLSQISWVLACAAFFLRPAIGEPVSIVLSNPLFFLFAILSHRGFIRFFGLGDPRRLLRWDVGVSLACLAVIYWNYFVVDSVGARVGVNSLAMCFLLFRAGLRARKVPRETRNRANLGLGLWLVAALLLLRACAVVIGPQSEHPQLLDPILKLVIMLGIFLMAFMVYGYIALMHERLEEDLLQAQSLLRQQANTDPLTGLLNRRGFMEIANHDIRMSRRYGHRMSLILFDLDHFKNINDTHGHAVGDTVLAAVGGASLGAMREADTLARWGGEEFAVLLPQTGLEDARLTAERLRELLRGLRPKSGADIMTTASFGVAELRDESFDELVASADQCLYRAKREGRDRVCVAG